MSTSERIATLEEADRLMTICNACRYCEGHCAVFPAMERRLTFDQASIDYLANLCHQCGACYHHCQYAEPHEFNVNVPRVFEQARYQSYEENAWPSFMSVAFNRGLAFSLWSLIGAILLFLGSVCWVSGYSALISTPESSFYSVIPHQVMAGIFGALGSLVLLTWIISATKFWRKLSLPSVFSLSPRVYIAGLKSALTLKNLDGGHGLGCYVPSEAPSLAKRWFHHLTMYGFLACFAATSVGTIYHYLLDFFAPYGWTSLPKILGTGGGIAMLIGLSGLFVIKKKTVEAISDQTQKGLGEGLILLLFITALSGLVLPVFAGSNYLGLLLCVHLGAVAALFMNFAWGKFIHALYRLIALVADAYEANKENSELSLPMENDNE